MRANLACVGATLLLAGCGGGVSGKYVSAGDSFLSSLNFKDEGKVDVLLINGVGGEGTYEVDGDTVRISANGSTNELTIGDDECLHGALLVGTFCKDGTSPSSAKRERPGGGDVGGGGGGLAGSTFEAAAEGGAKMVLQFTDGRTVRVTTVVPGVGEGSGSVDGTYSTQGDQVVIDIQGDPETFTRDGNMLTGDFGGDRVTFRRK